MQILKKIAPLICLGLLSLSTTAFARLAVPEPYTVMPLSSGLYGEINLGYGAVDAVGNPPRTGGIAAGFVIGYKLLTYLAVDVGYTAMPHVFVHTWTTHIALKGILPLGDGSWDVFAKLGGAIANGVKDPSINSNTTGVLYYGGGFTRWFQQNFGAILQGVATTSHSNTPSMYAITLGLTYFF